MAKRKAAGKVERATSAEHAQRMAYAAAKAEVERLGRARWGEQWAWLPEYEDGLRSELFGWPEIIAAEKLCRDIGDVFSNKPLRKKLERIAKETSKFRHSRPRQFQAATLHPLLAMVDAFGALKPWIDKPPTFTPWGDPRTCLAAHFDISFDAASVMLWRRGLPEARDLALLSVLLGFPKWEAYDAEKRASAAEIINDEARAMRRAMARIAAINDRDRARRGER